MVFKIVQVYKKDDAVLLTGRFAPVSEEERGMLDLMVDVFSTIEVYNNKFACNGKTLLFKSVKTDLVFSSIKYLAKELEMPIEVTLAPNFMGDVALLKDYSINSDE